MVLKLLLLNFPHRITIKKSDNVKVTKSTIRKKPTLHDFHVIFMDIGRIFDEGFWGSITGSGDTPDASNLFLDEFKKYGDKIKEQIETGGVTFCFAGTKYNENVRTKNGFFAISNYFSCPIDLGVVNDKGDTFCPRIEELKYYNILIKEVPLKNITYKCYFSKLPDNSRIIGVNRADYPVFVEIPIGNGKLVVLPRFKDMHKVANILKNDVIPQMIHEDEPMLTPKWIADFSSPLEDKIKNTLSQITKAKRLLYVQGKALKKAVAFAFEQLGFVVKVLPDGTNPDIEIFDGKRKAICEVKGHKKRQTKRDEMLQLLGYSDENDKQEKSIFVSNHQLCLEPNKRKKEAFTDGAINLGYKNDFSLISAMDLFNVTMMIIQQEMNMEKIEEIRNKIMESDGIVHLP